MIKELLPPSIAVDEGIQKLAESTEGVFSFLFSEAGKTLIYSRIDELPEEVLDLLAWQFHIEGYELASTIEEKRSFVKKAIELHRYKGTKWAIKNVLQILNIDGVVKEWFEYAGEPYKFKVSLGITNKEITTQLRDKLIQLINEYKNTRSWLDEISLAYLTRGRAFTYTGTMAECYSECEMITKIEHSITGQAYIQTGTMAECYGYAVMEG